VITPLYLNNVQLRSGRVLPKNPPIVIQKTKSNLQKHKNQSEEGETSLPKKGTKQTEEIPIDAPIKEESSASVKPPFSERLKIDEGVEKKIIFPNYNMMDEFRNVCIKIPLLKAIKKYNDEGEEEKI